MREKKDQRIILVDLGHVVAELCNFHDWWRKMRDASELKGRRFKRAKKETRASFERFECNKISPEEFLTSWREILHLYTTSSWQFWDLYRSAIVTANTPMVECLNQAHQRGAILVLISNIDRERWQMTLRDFSDQLQLSLFHHTVLSWEVGFRKPQPEIYRYAYDRIANDRTPSIRPSPAHTLFIDDKKENCAGAIAALGLPEKNVHCYRIDRHEEAEAFLKAHGIVDR